MSVDIGGYIPYSFHCSFWKVETVIKDILGWLFGHLASLSLFGSHLVLSYFLEKFILLLFYLLQSLESSKVALDGIPAVPQLRAHLDRGQNLEGEAPSRKEGRRPRRSNFFSGVVGSFPGISRTNFKGPSEDDEEGEENPVEEEEFDGTEGVPAPVGDSQGTGGPTLAQSNQPVSNQSEPALLAIMQQMTQIMANIQVDSSSEASRPPALKTPSMKAPELLDGTQPFKVRSFVQSCNLANLYQDRKKVLYATSLLICRAAKWIEIYLSNLTNKDPN
ncbi:hypothetical protein O181_010665 [Austropuccinia psidii MF-1]|uniref:Uncharacterized protein n=1 Tax=Austropuccinia psidii MF-1 TaxID=1389203 RepID=A0A9Q3GL50_9BASI|nr:hypothetical protein [Austropuccinia psidii MF-1]